MQKTFTTALSSPQSSLLASVLVTPKRYRATGIVLLFILLASGCGPTPQPPPADPATEAWYMETTQTLVALNVEIRALVAARRPGEAAQRIQEGVALSKQLLQIPHPTLKAMEAASDLDELYGDMLQSNRHFAYAREFYQRNAARWRHWRPQTDDTRRRLKEATDAIARCDQELAAGH